MDLNIDVRGAGLSRTVAYTSVYTNENLATNNLFGSVTNQTTAYSGSLHCYPLSLSLKGARCNSWHALLSVLIVCLCV